MDLRGSRVPAWVQDATGGSPGTAKEETQGLSLCRCQEAGGVQSGQEEADSGCAAGGRCRSEPCHMSGTRDGQMAPPLAPTK